MPLEHPDAPLAAAAEWLPAEERRRCAGRSSDARRRFILSRAALRCVLGHWLGRAPGSLVLARNERGKPFLPDRADVHFSFSDCRGLALVAIATVPVGVDAEHERPLRRGERTVQRIFHPDTAALLARLPAEARTRSFIDAWTQREAHVKAVGGGLFHTADALPFDPQARPDGRLQPVRDRQTSETWSVARLEPAQGIRASVVVRGSVDTLHVHPAEAALALLEEMQ